MGFYFSFLLGTSLQLFLASYRAQRQQLLLFSQNKPRATDECS